MMTRSNFFYKVFTSILISSSALYLAESRDCVFSLFFNSSNNLTNGVTAMLFNASDGKLGIRVRWSIKPEHQDCQFTTLRVELSDNEASKDISVNETFKDFSEAHDDLDCNRHYIPKVTATFSDFLKCDSGAMLLYRSKTTGPPSQLQRVCVGPPSTSSVGQTEGRLNISWDPLPCNLQNGADINYTIQYTRLLDGTLRNISTSNSKLQCRQVAGGLYSCLGDSSLFITTAGEIYRFQVAAESRFGGSFSNPVNSVFGSKDTNCTESINADDSNSGTSTSSDHASEVPITSATSVTHDKENGSGPGPMTSQNANTGLYAAVATVFIVLLGVMIIVVVMIVLVVKIRKQRRIKCQSHDMVIEKSNNCNSLAESTTSSLALKQTTDDIHDRSEHEMNTPNKTSMMNALYEPASEPKIIDFVSEVQAGAGEQVTLRVNFTGVPKPTITWTFKGNKMEGDYATELGTDGSLLFVCVETKHAGRYHFEVSNRLGSVKGSVTLVVHKGEEEDEVDLRRDFESNPVTQEEFGEYVASLHSCNGSTFILQFESLASGEEGQEVQVGKSEANRPLNRFRNIIAYDDHRISLVPLPNIPECQNNYINASYIDGFTQVNKYIASQGPLPKTDTDFWRLVWQEKVRTIAMVTNIKEGKTRKCEQYWPEGGSGQSYGPFNLSLAEQLILADYTIRTIQLVNMNEGGTSRKVMQYHFTSWPDHGVPEYAGPILNYLRRINAQHNPKKGPILVHCSAGVGRTGTLIAIDIALSQASKEGQMDIPKIIVDMRRQRMKMVQTVDQYAFIHDAVLETLTCGDTQIPASDLRRTLDQLRKEDKSSDGITGFCKQFEVLGQVSPNPTEVVCDCAKRYPNKNRSNNFLPPDLWRVVMRDVLTNNYIHASYANGYKQRKGFIIAQSPMATTVRDFVKMLYERECGVVVMLCGCEEGGVEVCAQYWPPTAGTMMKYGEFMVSTVSINDTNDGFIQRAVTITDPKSGQVLKLTQFQMEHWSAEGLCSNPQALVHMINEMGVAQRRAGNKPIVVHGSDTVSRVGVFYSLVNAIEMCKTEGVVDVFQVVKALRIQKPGAVLTADQYQFIFDLILLFLDSFSIYSNFK